MEILFTLVTSKNYFMTDGEKPPSMWASKEDQNRFSEQRKNSPLIFMGSATFKASKEMILKAAQISHSKRVVFSNNPEKYKEFLIPGKLEFEQLDLDTLVQRYHQYQKALLVSGKAIALEFFKAKLVNRIDWTIEPMEFSNGIQFRPDEIPAQLTLRKERRLNTQKTILSSYDVQYPK